MKQIFRISLMLLLTLPLSGQNPGKHPSATTNTTAPDDSSCGPIGCMAPAANATSMPQGGSPVVIRSSENKSDQATAGQAVAASAPAASSTSQDQGRFESFAQDSVGHPLAVFGSNLFRNSGHDFAPSTSIAPTSDYVLGTGDEVLIRSWGKVDMDVRATVDRNGQIFVPRIGPLTVAGLRLEQLTDFIQGALARQFVGFQLSVSLGKLRSIQIFVLGQVRAPGVYTISSLSTLVNALFASGGPSATGTLRDIQLKRNGAVVTHFDVYKLLLSGDKSADVRLEPGDILFVPLVGPQIAVDGEVNTPGIYELKGDASVGDILNLAGGLTPIAQNARAVIERLVDHSGRSVAELSLDSKGLALPIAGGDVLRVFQISPKFLGAVTLSGNVSEPGRYVWRPGMRVSDVIPNLAFLLTRGYYNLQNAEGTSSPSNAASHDTEINLNYAVIKRLNPTTLKTDLIPFALGEAVSTPSSPENKELQAGDVIVVYSKNDVALPQELQAKFVRIDGQVKAPGTYRVDEHETLRDLVMRAGGLVPQAYLYASRLTRESVRQEQEEKLKALIDEERREAVVATAPAGGVLGTGTTDTTAEARKAYLEQLSTVHADGRIVLQLKPEAKTVADVPEFPLEDGDHFFIPSTPSTVEVYGTVYNQGTFRYLAEARAIEYLDASGGATRNADRKREFIIRADGTVISRQAVGGLEHLHMYPGDAVVVPPKFHSGFRGPDLTSLATLVSTFALTAVAIKALN